MVFGVLCFEEIRLDFNSHGAICSNVSTWHHTLGWFVSCYFRVCVFAWAGWTTLYQLWNAFEQLPMLDQCLTIRNLGCMISQVHLNHGWQNCFCCAKMSCGPECLTHLRWPRTGDCNVASSSKTHCPRMTESYSLSDSTGHVDVEDASFELQDLLSQPMRLRQLYEGREGSGVSELMSFCFFGGLKSSPSTIEHRF